MLRYLRIPFLLALSGALALLLQPPEGDGAALYSSLVPDGACLALAATAGPDRDGLPAEYVHARTLAEQLRTGVDPAVLETLELELRTWCGALALRSDAREFPWLAWAAEHENRNPSFATELFLAARTVVPFADAELREVLDRWGAPRDVKIAILQMYWDRDPMTGRNRTKRALEPERMRANDIFPLLVVDQVLAPQPSSLAEENLLYHLANATRVDPAARSRAIAVLGERSRNKHVAAQLIGIFEAERNNNDIRVQALKAIVKIDPVRGRRILDEYDADPRFEPLLHAVIQALRRELGMPALPGRGLPRGQ